MGPPIQRQSTLLTENTLFSAQAIDTQPANAVDNYISTGVRPGSEFTTPIQRVQRNIARYGRSWMLLATTGYDW